MDFKNWSIEKQIYSLGNTKVNILHDGSSRIVRKQIQISPDNREYVKYQLKLMKEINHPHVVKLLHHDQVQDKKIHVYMPYYSNNDLEDFILKRQVDFQKKIRMFIDILVGIMELHSRFIIHRDIKLKNIFVDENYKCVIGDLGIATKSSDSATSRVGTLCYQAPEVYSDETYNEKVDIWALGIIAYQLFNKKRNNQIAYPFISQQKIRKQVLSYDYVNYDSLMKVTNKIADLDQELPQSIKEMIRQMLQNDPMKRVGWVEFYKNNYLTQFDQQQRLSTFMAEYKLIEDTKQILKCYIQFIKESKQKYFFKLSHILQFQNFQYFTKKYQIIKDNKRDLHIIHYKIMQKIMEKYLYICSKNIHKHILKYKSYYKCVKNEMYSIQQRINYWLRNNNNPEIRENKKYSTSQFFYGGLKLVDKILQSVDKEDFKEMKQQ